MSVLGLLVVTGIGVVLGWLATRLYDEQVRQREAQLWRDPDDDLYVRWLRGDVGRASQELKR